MILAFTTEVSGEPGAGQSVELVDYLALGDQAAVRGRMGARPPRLLKVTAIGHPKEQRRLTAKEFEVLRECIAVHAESQMNMAFASIAAGAPVKHQVGDDRVREVLGALDLGASV